MISPELLERTARILCKIRGLDPDESLTFSAQSRWQSLLSEIKPIAEVLLALDEASGGNGEEEE